MQKFTRITIVTTRQNFKWTSMQEILPALEVTWCNVAKSLDVPSTVINVDNESIKQHLKNILHTDIFVIIAFNHNIAEFIKHVRTLINQDAPFVIHLHGLATVGLWPLVNLGIFNLLNQSDCFIGTCTGDLNCMNLTVKNHQTVIAPYALSDNLLDIQNKIYKQNTFCYIGRISEQKNIDLIIKSFKILKDKIAENIQLFIIGEEDHLGSPNMGLESSNYLSTLKNLTKELDLESCIYFTGFVPRERICDLVGAMPIFVSASTHSDENFGMAAATTLAIGGRAVLSCWGGHKSLATYFPETTYTCPVKLDGSRPTIDINQFSVSMELALHNDDFVKTRSKKIKFKEILIKTLTPIVNHNPTSKEKLVLTDIGDKIAKQQAYFSKQEHQIQKCFSSYLDPLAQIFLSSYQK